MLEIGIILFGALLLDLMFGDPQVSYHPVALAGRAALFLEPRFRRISGNGFLSGMWCSLSVYLIFSLAVMGLTAAAWALNAWAGIAVSSVLIYFTIAPRSLCGHAWAVEERLASDDLAGARRNIAMIVSRDPEALQEDGIVRSCVESLGENFADGVTAAIFYAAIGWLVGGPVGAATGAWLYRAANTLDATFGYKNERYRRFGTFPARFDDVLNFIPARLTLLAVTLAAGLSGLRPANAWRCAWRDHGKHPSPNSAWGMAAFAGALGVRLGGMTRYATGWEEYPHWGLALEPLQLKHIRQARRLVMVATPVFTIIMMGIVIMLRRWGV